MHVWMALCLFQTNITLSRRRMNYCALTPGSNNGEDVFFSAHFAMLQEPNGWVYITCHDNYTRPGSSDLVSHICVSICTVYCCYFFPLSKWTAVFPLISSVRIYRPSITPPALIGFHPCQFQFFTPLNRNWSAIGILLIKCYITPGHLLWNLLALFPQYTLNIHQGTVVCFTGLKDTGKRARQLSFVSYLMLNQEVKVQVWSENNKDIQESR